MSEIDNALKMLILLQSKRKMKIKELASSIEVSETSIRRYRRDLEKAGFSIESSTGKYGGYELYDYGYTFGLNLTLEDLTCLNFVEKLLYDTNNVFKKDFESFVQKIKINKKNLVKTEISLNDHLTKSFGSSLYKEKDLLLTIREAILLYKKIKVEYFSISSGLTKRIWHPYATFQYKDDLYLVAFCENKKEIRDFKLCRIKKFEVLEEKFEKIDLDLKKFMKNCLGVYKGNLIRLKLRISFPMSQIIKEKIWIENQKITENEDKSIIFEAEMRGLPEIKSWILSMGACVMVLEPMELAKEIRDEINLIKKMYCELK